MVYLFYYESGSPIYVYGETFDEIFGKIYDKPEWNSFHKLDDFPETLPTTITNFSNVAPLQLGRVDETRMTMKVFEVSYADDMHMVSFLIAGQRNLVESYLSANQTHQFQMEKGTFTLELVGCNYSHDIEIRY